MVGVRRVIRVIAVVEGQTERTFVRDVLAPELGLMLSARLVGKGRRINNCRNVAGVS